MASWNTHENECVCIMCSDMGKTVHDQLRLVHNQTTTKPAPDVSGAEPSGGSLMTPATHENIRTICVVAIALCLAIAVIWGFNAV